MNHIAWFFFTNFKVKENHRWKKHISIPTICSESKCMWYITLIMGYILSILVSLYEMVYLGLTQNNPELEI